MSTFGFIIIRHVHSEKTNKYWNQNVKLLRTFYPFTKIVIIDDSSNYEFVKQEFEYTNLEVIQSEYPRRGELLPYYYYLKHKFFQNAIIIHDSVFFHKKIHFEHLNGVNVLPLWHFHSDKENVENTKKIVSCLKNSYSLQEKLCGDVNILGLKSNKWYGCFGVQSYINLKFLERIEQKYGITRLISAIHCRADRCCLERIFGAIFCSESPKLIARKSLLGNIMTYQTWGYTFDQYMEDFKKAAIQKVVVKVWTGR
jgi:hypothetical protein